MKGAEAEQREETKEGISTIFFPRYLFLFGPLRPKEYRPQHRWGRKGARRRFRPEAAAPGSRRPGRALRGASAARKKSALRRRFPAQPDAAPSNQLSAHISRVSEPEPGEGAARPEGRAVMGGCPPANCLSREPDGQTAAAACPGPAPAPSPRPRLRPRHRTGTAATSPQRPPHARPSAAPGVLEGPGLRGQTAPQRHLSSPPDGARGPEAPRRGRAAAGGRPRGLQAGGPRARGGCGREPAPGQAGSGRSSHLPARGSATSHPGPRLLAGPPPPRSSSSAPWAASAQDGQSPRELSPHSEGDPSGGSSPSSRPQVPPGENGPPTAAPASRR